MKVAFLRRLYSTFAGGMPGIGLLLMRLVVGSTLVMRASTILRGNSPLDTTLIWVFLAGLGFLIVPGLWTPLVGALIAAIEVCQVFVRPGDPWAPLLLATLAAALAMLGPGLWSIDAHLFGWKRVEVPPRKTTSA